MSKQNDNDAAKKVTRDYPVGYRKPPLHTRFQKGQSGNPSGQRKRSKSFLENLNETLNSEVKIGNKKITLAEVVAKSLVKKAAEGNITAIKLLADLDEKAILRLGAANDDSLRLRFTLKLEEGDPREHWEVLQRSSD